MPATFELKTAKDGQVRFNLKATNGEIILTSELYKAKAGALNGIESVKKNAPAEARFNKLTAKNGKSYFTLRAGNSQVIGTSEMYDTEKARNAGIASVQKNAPGAKLVDSAKA
jgi:uncharacterized protein YegP (UPF0339 family)